MTLEIFIELMKNFGFPVASAIALALVIFMLLKWVMGKYEEQHAEYRLDIKDLMTHSQDMSSNFANSLTMVTDSFREEIHTRDETIGKLTEFTMKVDTFIVSSEKKLDIIIENQKKNSKD